MWFLAFFFFVTCALLSVVAVFYFVDKNRQFLATLNALACFIWIACVGSMFTTTPTKINFHTPNAYYTDQTNNVAYFYWKDRVFKTGNPSFIADPNSVMIKATDIKIGSVVKTEFSVRYNLTQKRD